MFFRECGASVRHKQIDILPDELVEQIADFALFLLAKRQAAPGYEEWGEQQWQDFSLEQFFREDEEITYCFLHKYLN